MEIIRHGNPPEQRVKTFVCYACGCKFLASNKEYYKEYDYYDDNVLYYCKCPEPFCNSVASEEK